MIIRSFFIPGIAHTSYLIGGTGSCLIVDPSRDTDRYTIAAAEEGMKVAGILLTHLHADFLSGHGDLATATGAPIYLPETANGLFPHIPVREGTEITMDDLSISVLETPGHTPEHVSYVLTHLSRGDTPAAVFCGDTLFVGDVGRPDLFPDAARELASALYTSLHEKLLSLPDHCEVYPAHGAGSLCGRSISAKQWSTIGYERRYNPALAIPEREEFITRLTTGMPAAPDHFSRCSGINRKGPALLSDLPPLQEFNPARVKERIDRGETDLVDIRPYDAFCGMHIPGSWNLDMRVNFSTFTGWALDPDRHLILTGYPRSQAEEAALLLRRVGIDQVDGFLSGGVQGWASAGYESDRVPVITARQLGSLMKGPSPLVLDVRMAGEFQGYHIPGAVNIPWPDLRSRYAELDKSRHIVVICGTGARASIACSILKRSGIPQLSLVAGGYTAWMASGQDTAL